MTPTDRNSNTAARPLIRPLAGVALALGMAALLTADFSPAVAQDRPNPQRRGVSSPPAPAQATSPAPTTRATTPTEALFDAVARNDMAQVQAALSRGADLNERNSLGMTATEMAVDRGYFEIGHFLLSSRTARPSARPASEASSPAARQPEPPPGATTQAAPVRRVDQLEITPPAPAGPAPALGARPVTAGPNDPFNPEAAPLGARLPVLDPPRNAPPALVAPVDSPAPKGITSALGNASNGITQPDMGQPDAAQPGAAAAANATPAQQPSAWRRIADWLTPWRKPSEPMGDKKSEIVPDARSAFPAQQSMTRHLPLVLASAPAPEPAPSLVTAPASVTALPPVSAPADPVHGAASMPEPAQTSAPAGLSRPDSASEGALADGAGLSRTEAAAAGLTATGSAAASQAASASFMDRLYGFLYSVPGSPSIIADHPVALPAVNTPPTASAEPSPPEAVADPAGGSWQLTIKPAERAVTQFASLDGASGPPIAMTDAPMTVAAEAAFARIAGARAPDGRLEVTSGEIAAPLTGTTFSLGQAIAVGKPMPAKPADRRAKVPCLYKDQGLVSFCVEPITWPREIAPAFDTSSVLYDGQQAVVRYEGDQASFIHTLFKADAFDEVVAYFEQMYGPATEVFARLIAPLAAPRAINPAAIWRSFDPASNIMTTLDVRSLDDARGTFPDARHGAVLLYRAWARPVFPQLSSVELLLLR